VEEQLQENEPSAKAPGLGEWVKSTLFGVLFFLLIVRPFLLQAYHVPSGSMERTLLPGDFLLVNKAVFGSASPSRVPLTQVKLPSFRLPGYERPERGDVLVFEFPLDRTQEYVKRCVAVGGDTVAMRDKVLYINGVRQEEPYAQHVDPEVRRERNRLFEPNKFSWQLDYIVEGLEPDSSYDPRQHPTRDNFGPLVVPAGKFFCLGDNRDTSSDSRFWGFVDRELIKGRPLILYFSWDSARNLPRFNRIAQLIQ